MHSEGKHIFRQSGQFDLRFTCIGDGVTFTVELAVPLLDTVAFPEEKLPATTGDGVIFQI